LEKGKLVSEGTAVDITSEYLNSRLQQTQSSISFTGEKPGDEYCSLHSVRMCNDNLHAIEYIDVREPVVFELNYEIKKEGCNPIVNYHLYSGEGNKIAVLVDPNKDRFKGPGLYRSTVKIPADFFNEGDFVMGVAISTLSPLQVHFQDQQFLPFRVVDHLEAITRNEYKGAFNSALRPLFQWENEVLEKVNS
jgi:lipopolysaccharide transport system ATP-binding protein